MLPPAAPYLRSHLAAERVGVTPQQLAHWARKGWLTRHVVGSTTFYASDQVDALIRSKRVGNDRSANVSPPEALAEARAILGYGPPCPPVLGRPNHRARAGSNPTTRGGHHTATQDGDEDRRPRIEDRASRASQSVGRGPVPISMNRETPACG